MILVIAAQDDAVAHWLTHSWSGDDAVLITPSSLSARGWQFRISAAGEQTLAIDEQRVVQKSAVRGVYTRLTHVRETDLAQIEAADRTYVASEMTAFLRGWLSSLTCNVVNPATSGCLAGPYWRPERWICAAAELG